jgi:DNA-3-methyladenine glycosylase
MSSASDSSRAGTPINPDYYERPVEQVAQDLLGTRLCVRHGNIALEGMIVETEAYGGPEDLASHSAFRRNGVVQAMWGPPGTLYVYKAYGMYPCFNVVTGAEGEPSAVLIRAVSILSPERDNRVASGPGRLGRRIGLEIDHNGHKLTCPPFWIEPAQDSPGQISRGPRVGVQRGDHRHWRFTVADHPAVSRPRPKLDEPS